MSSSGRRRWLRRGLVAAACLLLILAGVVAFVLVHAPHNVSHPGVEFTNPTTPTTTTTTPARKRPVAPPFSWPRYGYDAGRTRDLAAGRGLSPPFRVGWRYQDYALLEFPPDIYANTLYQVDDDGSAKAIDKRTGHRLWQTQVGRLAAASPALGIRQHLLFIPVLSLTGHSPGNGRLVALSMRSGHVVWSHPVPAGTESSPLAWENSVYFGDQAGNLYDLDARTGHVRWVYHASGAIKGGPALADGKVFVGDYAGRVYAVDARTGRPAWTANTSGADFGFGSGNFYATPAVAFGRVYLGNTDGRVYSYAEKTGQLAWATGTSAYVYASAAVADLPGVGPTVYVGSYDGRFYAFNAQSGAVRWVYDAGGRISGSATVVGDVVYFSDLGSRTTTGLDARTGKPVFHFPDGAFNPVVADPGAIYLSGYSMLYQLLPARHRPARRHTATPRHKRRVRPRRRK